MKQIVQQYPHYLMTSDRETCPLKGPIFNVPVPLEPIITEDISATMHEKCEAFQDDPPWEMVEPLIEESLAQVREGKVIAHEEFRSRIEAKYFRTQTT